MIEQIGVAVKFAAFFVASKVGKTGLTVTVDVWRPDGTQIVTGGSATELGGGVYTYTLASGSVTSEGEYFAVFKTSDATVDQQHIPALWVVGRAGVENLDAAISTRLATAGYTAPPSAAAVADQVWDEAMAGHLSAGSTGEKLNAAGSAADPLTNNVPGTYGVGTAGYALGRIGTATVTATQPVSGDGQVLLLVRGDDYVEADGRALEFSSASWPNLTGVTSVTLTVRSKSTDTVLFTKTDKVASRVVGAGTQTVVFEPAAADTAALVPPGLSAKFDVEAVLSTRKITLASGSVNVTEDQTRA